MQHIKFGTHRDPIRFFMSDLPCPLKSAANPLLATRISHTGQCVLAESTLLFGGCRTKNSLYSQVAAIMIAIME